MSDPTLFSRSAEPLAARMRPKTLDDFLGQEHLLGPGKALGELIRRGDVGSCIFWGPPGSGKTTLARLIANHTDRHFEPFSAVTEGVARVREIIKLAEERLKYEGRGTILFCDEIHRFNRAQQDAFLPWVENGIITLIGATTENPSFELTAPLLSRCRVFVFEPLKEEHIRAVIERAIERAGSGKRETGKVLAEEAIEALVTYAQGDARRARRQGGVPLPRLARGRARHRSGGRVSRDRAQVESGVRGVRSRDGRRARASRRGGAAAHPQCADEAHGGPGLWGRVSIRPRL